MPSSKSDPPSQTARLLPPTPSPKKTYGTLSDDPENIARSSSHAGDEYEDEDEDEDDSEVPKSAEKVHKEFKEIWPLCLGLWTA